MPSKVLMTAKEYHAAEGVSSTLLKSACSKTLIHAIETPYEPKEAALMGSALHDYYLTPEYFGNNFAVVPKVDRRTKVGKESWAKFEEGAQGKELLTDVQFESVKGMKSSILEHETASAMLKGGEAEFAYFATCPETGLTLKCKPDYIKDGCMMELKSAKDASPKGFAKDAANLFYHVSAAFYIDVYFLATGIKINEFYFIASENTAPHGTAVHNLMEGDEELCYGRMLYKKALKDLKHYIEDKEQNQLKRQNYLYGNGITKLQFPNWAFGA